ncbi:MAG TPA: CUAEP/CCAEP-tail radical SAM protein [Vicinamibacterales bacterium]|nr:CUAEP/CCAEP-tail radical SAM protein [Vicinamibacterales bacterium]
MSSALLVSTYEMGRQPFGVASAAAWLRAGGWEVRSVDTAKEKVTADRFGGADLIGFHLPMHTATRLAGPVIAVARRVNPDASIAAFGLYAPLNEAWLHSLGVDAVFGGEFEEELADLARRLHKPRSPQSPERKGFSAVSAGSPVGRSSLPRIHFLVPDRSTLPPLTKYASLQMPDGSRRIVGSTEASRGCLHSCRHCPVVPVYEGQFRVVQPEVVLADVAAQVAVGASHITFGDPDFFNGPTHAIRIVRALHAAHPSVSYDVTIKIEHLLKHRHLVPALAATGCAFVTSAVESLDDGVLAIFDKGHTRADFVEAVHVCRSAGVSLVPTFVAFHPWLTLGSYCELLDTIESLELVDYVAPIQLVLRLLVHEGSRLITAPEMRPHLGRFDPATLTYRWAHPDPRVDGLHDEVFKMVGARLNADRRGVFEMVSTLAHERAGIPRRHASHPVRARATVPYLDEPWYC